MKHLFFITLFLLSLNAQSQHLLTFEVKQIESNALIEWSTIDSDVWYFDIEKSYDGYSFYAVERVRFDAPGFYQFKCPVTNADSILFFQIKQVHLDSSITYSNLDSLSVTPIVTVNKNTNLLFTDLKGTDQLIQITTPEGKLLFTKVNSDNQLALDVNFLPPGNYFVLIISEDGTSIYSFLK